MNPRAAEREQAIYDVDTAKQLQNAQRHRQPSKHNQDIWATGAEPLRARHLLKPLARHLALPLQPTHRPGKQAQHDGGQAEHCLSIRLWTLAATAGSLQQTL